MSSTVPKYSPEESGAFVEQLRLDPTGSGPLDGLTFAVKDLVDLKGYVTGCGNPQWRDSHPPAVAHAVGVEQILAAGAVCLGKTVSDELAFSLDGENFFYGTPLNPKAPDRVPGGSSSGSASAVACCLVDFALGTDTGGMLKQFLGPRDLLVLPTVPAPAPLKGTLDNDRVQGNYYPRTLSMTAMAGICRLPQVTMPVAGVAGAPVGLSLAAAHGEDAFLLAAVRDVTSG
jgi:Asp-tRNA(Asn)/Glu-tRNA(Gln) amidotransferase A subunit family amidase